MTLSMLLAGYRGLRRELVSESVIVTSYSTRASSPFAAQARANIRPGSSSAFRPAITSAIVVFTLSAAVTLMHLPAGLEGDC
jgi:hypothetical protein